MKKILSILLAVVMVVSIFATVPFSAAEKDVAEVGAWSNSYTITGNGANDIVAVAQAQVGKSGSNLGYSSNWCARFVAKCASLAGQASAVPDYGAVSTLYTKVKEAGGYAVTSPQKGDLVFYKCTVTGNWCHVAIMRDSINSLQGNWNNSVVDAKYTSFYDSTNPYVQGSSNNVKCWTATFIRPKYKNNTHTTHSYSTYAYYWAAHPHYKTYKCSCGVEDTKMDQPTYVSSCSSCNLTVSYNANGGAGAPANQTKKYLSDLTLSSQVPHRNGYAFCGWATSSTATSASYMPGQVYSSHSALTLYAVWKEIFQSYTERLNGHVYKYYDLPVSWTEAYNICESLGGHLVTISSEEENDFVLSIASEFDNSYCWLGATDFSKEDDFYWVNCEPFNYDNWNETQPDNYANTEHFVHMYIGDDRAGKWNDLPNSSIQYVPSTGFICEFDDVDADEYTTTDTFTYNNTMYEIYDVNVDWQTAKKVCEAKGGHLLIIDSLSEQAAVYQNIQDTYRSEYWLGINDVESEGNWIEIKNSNALVYDNWYSGEPNDDAYCEDYAVIKQADGTWIDLKGFSSNYRSIGFICEYDKLEKLELTFEKLDYGVNAVCSKLEGADKYKFIWEEGASTSTTTTSVWSDYWTSDTEGNFDLTVTVQAYDENEMLIGASDPIDINVTVTIVDEWRPYGDVNNDKDINIIDVTEIQSHIAKRILLDKFESLQADVDDDGEVTIIDATTIQLHCALYGHPSNIGKACYCYGTDYDFIVPEKVEADWVLASSVPSGAEITARKYTYTLTETTTSSSSSLDGWTLTGYNLVETKSGSHKYATYPKDFSSSHSLYNKYSKNGPISAYDNETEQRTVSNSTVATYIYWHWCRGDDSVGPIDRRIERYPTNVFTTFDAFESSTDKPYNSSADAHEYSNKSCCGDTYWWNRMTVYQQTYTIYSKSYNYSKTSQLESDSKPTGSNISDIQEWVKYK